MRLLGLNLNLKGNLNLDLLIQDPQIDLSQDQNLDLHLQEVLNRDLLQENPLDKNLKEKFHR